MNRLLYTGLISLTPIFFSSCTTDGNVTVGGVPAWIASGAQFDDEPAPYKPDPAIIHFDSESGPLEFEIVTDQHEYKKPKATTKKSSSSSTRDPIERGRESRLKRLLR